MSMAERVARAIFDAENGLDGDRIGDMLYEDFRIEGDKDEAIAQVMMVCRMAARAAISAVEAWNTKAGYVTVPREPTEAMVNADFDRPNRRLPITGEEVIDIWRAMCDAALSE